MGGEDKDTHGQKDIRKRKKRLYRCLKERMEFYLSEPNIRHDAFVREKYYNENGINVEEFLTFNRIKELTSDVEDLKKALSDSTVLKLDDSGKKVCRITSITEKSDIDDCTIYVENVNPEVNPPYLQSIFSRFGTVDYVSIPKFKNKKGRGFAFVEFGSKEEADRALLAFKENHCLLPLEMDPQNLQSISTFNQNEENTDLVVAPLKRKASKLNNLPVTDAASEASDNEGGPPPKKAKKNRKKKKYQKTVPPDIQSLGLLVLPKREWKRLRNKYLNLQAKERNLLKSNLAKRPTKPVKSTLCEKRSRVIIQVDFASPLTEISAKAFKTEAKALEQVAYVDMHVGETRAYLRMETSEAAQNLLSKKDTLPWQISSLPASEESAYWRKAEKDRENAYNCSRSKKRKRGTSRLFDKVEKIISKELFISVDE